MSPPPAPFPTAPLGTARLDRFARHIVLPEVGGAGQVALAGAHVVLIGCGGIGSPALQYLAGAGVGRLTYDLLVSSFESLRDEAAIAESDDLADVIASHVELAVLDREGTPTDASLRELTRDRVKRFVDVNLDDPHLSLDRVAAAVPKALRI